MAYTAGPRACVVGDVSGTELGHARRPQVSRKYQLIQEACVDVDNIPVHNSTGGLADYVGQRTGVPAKVQVVVERISCVKFSVSNKPTALALVFMIFNRVEKSHKTR